MPEPIGKQLRQFRKTAEMTLGELAELTKLYPTTISSIESGKTENPGWNTVCLILKHLAVRISLKQKKLNQLESIKQFLKIKKFL